MSSGRRRRSDHPSYSRKKSSSDGWIIALLFVIALVSVVLLFTKGGCNAEVDKLGRPIHEPLNNTR